jgi:hypothetical protein
MEQAINHIKKNIHIYIHTYRCERARKHTHTNTHTHTHTHTHAYIPAASIFGKSSRFLLYTVTQNKCSYYVIAAVV